MIYIYIYMYIQIYIYIYPEFQWPFMATEDIYKGDKLVGDIPTLLTNMTLSVGIMKFPMYGKIKFMFQTTNQYIYVKFRELGGSKWFLRNLWNLSPASALRTRGFHLVVYKKGGSRYS